jgi:release factor glutamine methyltransferase
MKSTIAEVLREAGRKLESAGVPEARREAGSFLSFILGKDRTFLISHAENCVDDNSLERLHEFVDRRATGEPLQYITGVQDFYGREFRVTPDVLIPRPETEILVEAALQIIRDTGAAPLICDVGTGSGCIAITLLCEVADARVVAIDKSPAALEVAKLNAQHLSVADRVGFVVSDCFSSLDSHNQKFDLIVSNPPYIAEAVLAELQREVRDHEPVIALSPGPDGLSIIRRLIDDAPPFIKPGGHMLLEIGFDQGEAVTRLANDSAWTFREIRPDLQGIPRILILQMT